MIIVVILAISLYIGTVVERYIKSKRKCLFTHKWVEYSPRHVRLDLLSTLLKIGLYEKSEYESWKDAMKYAKGSMLSHYTCTRCLSKRTHRESL